MKVILTAKSSVLPEFYEFFVKVLLDRKLVFKVFTVELVEELENVTWRNINIVISHVIELEEIKMLSRGLSNEL